MLHQRDPARIVFTTRITFTFLVGIPGRAASTSMTSVSSVSRRINGLHIASQY
jgi:hypothetical protein